MSDTLPPVADIPAAPAYGDVQSLIVKFGIYELRQLAPALDQTEEEDGLGLDMPRLDDALLRASREADSYLATRYAVPLSRHGDAWPEPLASFVADMARYHLTGGDAQASEDITRRYAEALDWLKAVAKGVADLPPSPDNGDGGDESGEGVSDVAFVQCGRQEMWR